MKTNRLFVAPLAVAAEVVEALMAKLGITRFTMYLMDFGGPIGYRLMLKYPDRLRTTRYLEVRRSLPHYLAGTQFLRRQGTASHD